MITYEDCLALAGLTEEEVAAVARHEKLPEMLAAELGGYLCAEPGGTARLQHMIRDDIEAARRAGNCAEAARLRLVLRHFCATHPASG
ncbi:hypothetical protein SH611_12430 [Geminicoccaceae bacterium 1502E]|nr:hypothetical protein [Geminicoccaceae bacterium 1502E]